MTKNDLIGYQWALKVVNGEEIANKYVKLECERYVKRVENEVKNIKIDYKQAKKIYNLLKLINYSTGFYAGEPIIKHIHGFQAMILENIFCLYYDNGKRVVEEVYLEIGRKAGKSFISALIELLIMLTSPQFAQTACAGKTRDISSLVRTSLVELIKSSPYIKKYFKITRDKITCTMNECTMKHLSGEADNINGLLLSSYVVDEVANQTDSSIIDALKLSQMSTKTRLAIYISTQYGNPINAFNDLIDYHKKVLDGVVDADNTFGLLFELDQGDDFNDESNWYKCNPLQMSLEDGREFLRKEYKKGLTIESAMNEFRIKILNERLNLIDGELFVDFKAWQECEVEEVDFSGKEVVLSTDLSISLDLSSVNATYKDGDNYYSCSWGFLGVDSIIERPEKFNYFASQSRGECFINKGRIVDYNVIEDFIVDFEKEHDCKIVALVTDPYNALQLMQSIDEKVDFPIIFLKQTFANLTGPTDAMQRAIYEGNYYHKKNKLYDLHISDTQITYGRSGDKMIDKATARKSKGAHIDLVATSVFSMSELYTRDDINWDEEVKNGWIC